MSCSSRQTADLDYAEVNLMVVDTVKVSDELGFFQKPSKVELIADSILIASSIFNGISVYDIADGRQLNYLGLKGEYGSSLFYSSFMVRNYPNIEILDGFKGRLWKINLDKKADMESISLAIPEGYKVKALDPVFLWRNGVYHIELVPDGVPVTHKDFYRLSGKFLGTFDLEGKFIDRYVEYPAKLTSQGNYIYPINYHRVGGNDTNLIMSFPSENSIKMYAKDFSQKPLTEVNFPDFLGLDFAPVLLEKEFNPRLTSVAERVEPAIFDAIMVSGEKVFISTVAKNNSDLGNLGLKTNLLIFDYEGKKWSATYPLQDFFELGKLAGIVGDTLYFFEASLVNSDEKKIYKVVVGD
ncbi:hypothetical protein [Litoribacter populi]|uniref:hypothetical protein n=1 Tax=Litoribacter populi TaxID=2598460 RepID=UPI0011804397|nr:hypothetical protein [Litoribacter populi]